MSEDRVERVRAPGAEMCPWPRTAHVTVLPRAMVDPQHALAVDRAWEARRRVNPALHDGPILAIESSDPRSGEIVCRRDSYRRLAVSDEVETGIRHLGVNGVLESADQSGVSRVLVGRRSPRTRVYGGMWELAPAGGVEPPQTDSIDTAGILEVLANEAREELGLAIPVAACEVIGLVRDFGPGRHDNLVVRVPLGTRPALNENWEYTQAEWVDPRDADTWPVGLIPPTRATLRWLGKAQAGR